MWEWMSLVLETTGGIIVSEGRRGDHMCKPPPRTYIHARTHTEVLTSGHLPHLEELDFIQVLHARHDE